MKYFIAVSPIPNNDAISNIRAEPNTTSRVVGTLGVLGLVAERLDEQNGWSKYMLPYGIEGWLRNDVHWYTPLYHIELNLPYVSQVDADSDQHINECGIAGVAMPLRAYGHQDKVEDLANSVGMTYKSLTLFDYIFTISRRFKLPHTYRRPYTVTDVLRNLMYNKISLILVNHKHINGTNIPHFVDVYGSVDGYALIHDPYLKDNKKVTLAQLSNAMRYTTDHQNFAWQGIEYELPGDCI